MSANTNDADATPVACSPGVALKLGQFDPLAEERVSSALDTKGVRTDGQTDAPRRMVEFVSPSDLKNALTREGSQLVGDFHVEKGSPFVLAGAPGVGKSRAAVALAVAGATGADWFGLKVHRKFKTMILQAENGPVRLKNEFGEIDCDALNDYVRVSPQPPYGFAFHDRFFLSQVREAVKSFKPDVFLIDPWNHCVRDSMEKDYMEGFERVRSVLPVGDECPAIGIVAHTRKPRMGEKASGRSLLNLLSGSYVLASVPRSACVIQPASDDTDDKRVVFTCCKNNNGELGKRSAWERRNGLFVPVSNFNWEHFDNGGEPAKKRGVTEEHILELFENGDAVHRRTAAAERLQEIAGVGRTTAFKALETDGEFGHLVVEREDRTLALVIAGGAKRNQSN